MIWHHQLPIKGEVTFFFFFFFSSFEDEWGNVMLFSKNVWGTKSFYKSLPFLFFLDIKGLLSISNSVALSEPDAWLIFVLFQNTTYHCSALRQARFINSTTCSAVFLLSPLHWDKKCPIFNASIHSLTNKHYVWVALFAYSMCVFSYWFSVLCVFSFRGREAASLCFVYLAMSQGCLTNAFWIVSPRTFVLCFIHSCDVL